MLTEGPHTRPRRCERVEVGGMPASDGNAVMRGLYLSIVMIEYLYRKPAFNIRSFFDETVLSIIIVFMIL